MHENRQLYFSSAPSIIKYAIDSLAFRNEFQLNFSMQISDQFTHSIFGNGA